MSALGQKQTSAHLGAMSALPPKADIGTHSRDVCFVPKADICTAANSRYRTIPSYLRPAAPLGIASKRVGASNAASHGCPPKPVEKQEVMFRVRKRDWIIVTALILAGAVGYGVYSKWTEEGLRRTEADMKSNLPLRVDQNTTLVDVKYDRTHSTYWYVIDKVDQFDPQETAQQVQIGVCTNADNSSTMKKEGFSYEYHYRTKDGLALTDFKVTTCE